MKIFRDPITHFVLIGLLLLGLNHFWNVWQGEQGRTIRVSAAEIDRLGKIWAGTAGRLPTGEDQQQIIDQYVQEEMLVREAERLGLSDGDTIIRRRLAQKMDFLVSDDATANDPTDAELERWFEDHRERFAAPEMRSFTHVYFSPEKHGSRIEAAAETARTRLQSGAEWKSLGDPFIQKRSYAAVPEREVARLFGPKFATDIFKLGADQWSEPVGSAFGLHLVRIEAIDSAAQAQFASIRNEVLVAWQDEQRSNGKRAALKKLIGSYEVIIEKK
ncbi:peptidylprolyl isomerase [Parasphingorhabdus sp.]|uniref:peptidylprolyl isomerase n=1 Tax=Parasphingorhabdus sp. TaxID=2709688 RepID=UPI0030A748B0|nr:peptidyl-prolyl cis-trans isomerase [Sphingomonadales bacterium]